jgi:hypothetical protein
MAKNYISYVFDYKGESINMQVPSYQIFKRLYNALV